MGRSTTPTYRVELRVHGAQQTPQAWHVRGQYGAKGYGKPTLPNLHEWVVGLEMSCLPGGVNAQVYEGFGYCPILSATIIRQRDGEVMAEWTREAHRDLDGDTRLAETETKYPRAMVV